MLTIENNPRAVRSPYGSERVTRARNRKNFPPPEKKSKLTLPRHLRCARICTIRAAGVLSLQQPEQIF